MAERSIREKLLLIQMKLKVEKNRYNEFGKFYSRSKEDVLEAVKPLAHEEGCAVLVHDDIRCMENGWVYVVSEAELLDVETGEHISERGWAREPESKPKMDSSQVTGSAASYAGKRALGNLFAIDDTADADQLPPKEEAKRNLIGQELPIHVRCARCGQEYDLPNDTVLNELLHDPRACGCAEQAEWEVR